jgi:geranylgeranyl pyrophosphate synthase
MTQQNLKEYMKLVEEIETIGERSRSKFREIVLKDVNDSELKDCIEHVLSYWKDNIRPALIQFSYEAVGGNLDIVDDLGLFFSISGSGIGIHDDIIDKTNEKHDRKTVPNLFGQDYAITVGDLLMVKGLTWIRESLSKVDNNTSSRILEEYDRFFTEMCVGEAMEIKARRNLDLSIEEYEVMLWKLGVDTEACCKIGAILGDGNEQDIEILGSYGRNLGFLNRLYDELKDVVNWEGNLFNRLYNESIPLPILYSTKVNKTSYSRIFDLFESKDFSNFDHREIFIMCHFDGAFNYVHTLANNVTKKTYSVLKNLVDSPIADKVSLLIWKINEDLKKIGK